MSDKKFLEADEVPLGFDITCELKWFRVRYGSECKTGSCGPPRIKEVLCQKYRGAFRDVWVRIPISD